MGGQIKSYKHFYLKIQHVFLFFVNSEQILRRSSEDVICGLGHQKSTNPHKEEGTRGPWHTHM